MELHTRSILKIKTNNCFKLNEEKKISTLRKTLRIGQFITFRKKARRGSILSLMFSSQPLAAGVAWFADHLDCDVT